MSDPNTREAGVSPGVEGPADEYFTSQNYESWDIIDYLEQFGNLDSKDRLLNSWWKSLHWRGQGTSPAASKAGDLIRAKDQDKVRARDFFSTRKHPGVVAIVFSQSHIAIQVHLVGEFGVWLLLESRHIGFLYSIGIPGSWV